MQLQGWKAQRANWWASPHTIYFNPWPYQTKATAAPDICGEERKSFGLLGSKLPKGKNIIFPSIIICARARENSARNSEAARRELLPAYLPDWWCGDEGPNSNSDLREATPDRGGGRGLLLRLELDSQIIERATLRVRVLGARRRLKAVSSFFRVCVCSLVLEKENRTRGARRAVDAAARLPPGTLGFFLV